MPKKREAYEEFLKKLPRSVWGGPIGDTAVLALRDLDSKGLMTEEQLLVSMDGLIQRISAAKHVVFMASQKPVDPTAGVEPVRARPLQKTTL